MKETCFNNKNWIAKLMQIWVKMFNTFSRTPLLTLFLTDLFLYQVFICHILLSRISIHSVLHIFPYIHKQSTPYRILVLIWLRMKLMGLLSLISVGAGPLFLTVLSVLCAKFVIVEDINLNGLHCREWCIGMNNTFSSLQSSMVYGYPLLCLISRHQQCPAVWPCEQSTGLGLKRPGSYLWLCYWPPWWQVILPHPWHENNDLPPLLKCFGI